MLSGILALLIIILDRAVKAFAADTLRSEAVGRLLIFGLLRLVYVENTGMAFGLLAGQTPLLAAFSALAIGGACYAFRRYRLSGFSKVAIGFALGGAVGNLIDRIALGYVVDMFEFTFVSFAVFNLADAALVIGMIMLMIGLLFMPGEWEAKA